ncbi:MAG TPA: hypothetical protein DGD08_08500 [Gemmatimonas aurantiaca]|uniref:Uncharacterized protein n=2 Tax=Gemmatimonas aurantiaca TaxID=173480 RepID=A0A3D4V9C5_9BACT|nr:hypothetical protein [Gemmatimonas aurantiaca]BAH38877.1 hypothetical membrane protein [Gemmatimonas aurantiaca T-27]HCT57238.1 hypothetical protein [Gemmatimonas aurantiaca]
MTFLPRFLRDVPFLAWIAMGVMSAIVALIYSIGAYGDARYAAGKRDAASGARLDSVVIAPFVAKREAAVQRTDSAVKRVRKATVQVRDAIAVMPDSVQRLPSVAPVVIACTTLQERVDSLLVQVDTERAAHTMERSVLEAQNKAAHAVIAVQADSIRSLEKRPTWMQAGGLAIGGAVLGVIGGLLR